MQPGDDTQRRIGPGHGSTETRWGRRMVVALVVVIGLIAAWALAAAVIPRWWAQRVGNLIDGRMTVGSLVGLVTGASFTFLPMLALWAGLRFRRGWRRLLGFVLLALVLALPNLFLLGIVLGNGNAAHAGERILDVDGPGFRGASLIGAVVGALAFAVLLYLMLSRNARGRRAARLRDELHERDLELDQAQAQAPPPADQ